MPEDEWQAIALNYTSGTSGDPKGAVYSHRGAYLNALGNALVRGRPATVYLWILPCSIAAADYPWAVSAVGGTHVCVRKVDPAFSSRSSRSTGQPPCAAPVSRTCYPTRPMTIGPVRSCREVATGGAPPPSAIIAAMGRDGFRVTHLYGLTESYGPSLLCAGRMPGPASISAPGREDGAAGRPSRRAGRRCRGRPETLQQVPSDGRTVGEILLRGNTIMEGYLENPAATAEAFRNGWFNTGDLAVRHPDGYIEVKDRSKDIIISGGENIRASRSRRHSTATPRSWRRRWWRGRTKSGVRRPVRLSPSNPRPEPSAEEMIEWCRSTWRGTGPETVIFGELPKTSTGKIRKNILRDRVAQVTATPPGNCPGRK